ncbi:hypothetical protein L7F22_010857 [Adiantum nelumboides]|nr:hypothetical protein [Adiantum nelumboides]
MQQVFPPPSVHPGYFGGGSVFQSMAGHAPRNQFYTPRLVFGGAQAMIPNPMYGQNTSGQGTLMSPNGVPMFQSLPYDNLTSLEKPNPYKEGGKGVTFSTFIGFDDRKKALSFSIFTGFDDRKKALSFLQQIDKAYAGRYFIEASKLTRNKHNNASWCNLNKEMSAERKVGTSITTTRAALKFMEGGLLAINVKEAIYKAKKHGFKTRAQELTRLNEKFGVFNALGRLQGIERLDLQYPLKAAMAA